MTTDGGDSDGTTPAAVAVATPTEHEHEPEPEPEPKPASRTKLGRFLADVERLADDPDVFVLGREAGEACVPENPPYAKHALCAGLTQIRAALCTKRSESSGKARTVLRVRATDDVTILDEGRIGAWDVDEVTEAVWGRNSLPSPGALSEMYAAYLVQHREDVLVEVGGVWVDVATIDEPAAPADITIYTNGLVFVDSQDGWAAVVIPAAVRPPEGTQQYIQRVTGRTRSAGSPSKFECPACEVAIGVTEQTRFEFQPGLWHAATCPACGDRLMVAESPADADVAYVARESWPGHDWPGGLPVRPHDIERDESVQLTEVGLPLTGEAPLPWG